MNISRLVDTPLNSVASVANGSVASEPIAIANEIIRAQSESLSLRQVVSSTMMCKHVIPFLNLEDQVSVSEVSKQFRGDIQKKGDLTKFKTIQEKIQQLPTPASLDHIQPILLALLESPFIGSEEWENAVSTCLKRLMPDVYNSDLCIEAFQPLATFLSSLKMDDRTITCFCKSLGRSLKAIMFPWMKYRIFESFFPCHPELVRQEIQNILLTTLRKHRTMKSSIQIGDRFRGRALIRDVIKIVIDSRYWFGLETSRYSLWMDLETRTDTALLPDLIQEVLFQRCHEIASQSDCPLIVYMQSKRASQIKTHHNFHLPLVTALAEARIFVGYCQMNRMNMPYTEELYDRALRRQPEEFKQEVF